jgi:hypothetical protein
MTQVITAIALWVLFCICVTRLRRGHDFSIALSALCLALTFTITTDAVYVQVDNFLGGNNLADLAKQTTLVFGVFFLSRCVIGAVGIHNEYKVRRIALIFLISVLIVQTLAFFAIDATPSTVHFMNTFGDRPATLVYSLSHFVYFGVVLGITGWVTFRFAVIPSRDMLRIAMSVLVLGCFLSVLIALVITVRDIARIIGPENIVDPLNGVYKILLVTSTCTIALGLSIPPIATAFREARNRRRCQHLIAILRPALHRIRLDDRRFTLDELTSSLSYVAQLHRIVVEIRDTQLVNPNLLLLNEEDQALIQAETVVTTSDFITSKF